MLCSTTGQLAQRQETIEKARVVVRRTVSEGTDSDFREMGNIDYCKARSGKR